MKQILKFPYEWRITGFYLVIGFLWIVFTDIILIGQAKDLEAMRLLQTYTAWIYLAITSCLFYFFIKQSSRKARNENVELIKEYNFYKQLFVGYRQAAYIFEAVVYESVVF